MFAVNSHGWSRFKLQIDIFKIVDLTSVWSWACYVSQLTRFVDPNTQYFSRFHVISDNFVNIQPIKL